MHSYHFFADGGSCARGQKVESELYDSIFGEKDRKAGKMKERSRQRKYGTHALAVHLMGKSGGGGGDVGDTNPSPENRRDGSSGVGGKGSGDRKGAKKRWVCFLFRGKGNRGCEVVSLLPSFLAVGAQDG